MTGDEVVPFVAAHDQEEFSNRLVILSSRAERWIRTCAD